MATLQNPRNSTLSTATSRVTAGSVEIVSSISSLSFIQGTTPTVSPTSFTLQARATGYVNPSYQWYSNLDSTGNSIIPGATSMNLTVSTDTASFKAAICTSSHIQYSVVVSETKVNSSSAEVSLPVHKAGGRIDVYAYRITNSLSSPSTASGFNGVQNLPYTGSPTTDDGFWYANPPSDIPAGKYCFQVAGVRDASDVYTWQSSSFFYNMKVGKLEAFAVSTGTLTVGSDGHIKGGQTAYDTGNGFFLGYSGGTYKFSIGKANQQITSLTGGTTLGLASHGYTVGTAIIFYDVGDVSAGIEALVPYYVRTIPSSDSFTIAAVPGGSVITMTYSSGALPVIMGRSLNWTGSGLELRTSSLISVGGIAGWFIGTGTGSTPSVIIDGTSQQQNYLQVYGKSSLHSLEITDYGNGTVSYGSFPAIGCSGTAYFQYPARLSVGLNGINSSMPEISGSVPTLLNLHGTKVARLGGGASSPSKTNRRNCIVASTANVTLGTNLTGPLTIDGYQLPLDRAMSLEGGSVYALRVALKNQTTTSQNGVYEYSVNSDGTYNLNTLVGDLDSNAEITNSLIYIAEGTTNAGKLFSLGGTIGATTFTEYTGAGEAFTSRIFDVTPAGGNILYCRDTVSSSTIAVDIEAKKTASSVANFNNTATSGGQVKLGNIDSAVEFVRGGAKFPSTFVDSTDANTLDDYKEGTWTSTVVGTGTGISVVSGSASYTKVGRAVHFTIALSTTGAGTSGDLTFTLPSTTTKNFAFSVFAVGLSAIGGPVLAWVDSGSNTVTLAYLNLADGQRANNLATKTTSSTDIRVSGTYW